MLWSMAHPQRTIPTLITILVVMAGVDGNWMMVYKTISEVGDNRKETACISDTKKNRARKSETKKFETHPWEKPEWRQRIRPRRKYEWRPNLSRIFWFYNKQNVERQTAEKRVSRTRCAYFILNLEIVLSLCILTDLYLNLKMSRSRPLSAGRQRGVGWRRRDSSRRPTSWPRSKVPNWLRRRNELRRAKRCAPGRESGWRLAAGSFWAKRWDPAGPSSARGDRADRAKSTSRALRWRWRKPDALQLPTSSRTSVEDFRAGCAFHRWP